MMSTGDFIRALARKTRATEAHGEVVEVRVNHDGRVIDRGSYMVVDHYRVTFADGAVKTYWIRGYVPVELKQ
jgi:hypothetical protein